MEHNITSQAVLPPQVIRVIKTSVLWTRHVMLVSERQRYNLCILLLLSGVVMVTTSLAARFAKSDCSIRGAA